MAFTKDINQNTIDSHQISPAYVLTFLRWENRDTKNYPNVSNLNLLEPLIVYNDAISVSVQNSKSSLSSSMSCTLMSGDINYSAAIAPGDFVFLNMVNWEVDAQRIRDKAAALKPINEYNDGFKGLFKVQTVRKRLTMIGDAKTLVYTIQAAAFTEFNNVIYYNPVLNSVGPVGLYMLKIESFFQGRLASTIRIQEILPMLFSILIGNGIKKNNENLPDFGSVHFRMPPTVGKLLGKDITYASDLYSLIIGGWGSSSGTFGSAQTTGIGARFNQGIKHKSGSVFTATYPIPGDRFVSAENWNHVTAWSILQSYANLAMNEMYTTFRVNSEGKVMPSLIIRQKPFNTPHYKGPGPVTKFFDLPRWRISPNLLLDIDLGKEEAARYNLVQIYSQVIGDASKSGLFSMEKQIDQGNYVEDIKDISRNGLKPYVLTSNFQAPDATASYGPAWARISADWLIGGHLKESGTISCVGIQDPISVGDNLELDGIVYHIEAVSHSMMINKQGFKNFRTTISLSYGMDLRSDTSIPVYPEMDLEDRYDSGRADYAGERLLPGFSDTQDITGRTDGEELTNQGSRRFTNPKPKKLPNSKKDGTEDKPSNK